MSVSSVSSVSSRRRRASAIAGTLSLLALGLTAPAAAVTAAVAGPALGGVGAVPAVMGNPPKLPIDTVSPTLQSQGDVVFGCQKPGAGTACYGPAQIRHAYNIDNLIGAGFTGKGRTIVIVDAFQSPTVRQDLKAFDDVFGLPPADLQIVAPDGLTPFDASDANQVGWASEISLDVQWAHAVAPGARIVLVLAKTNDDINIQRALSYAVDHDLGDVISQSFGEAESCYGVNADGSRQRGATLAAQHKIFQRAQQKGMTVFAASGDSGSTQPSCNGKRDMLAASTPATDPLVTAVGGTKLYADLGTGRYRSEVVWNEEKDFGTRAVGGGGYSSVYERPAFQRTAGDLPGRGVPDVAYNAAIDRGVIVAFSAGVYPPGSFFLFGGTSSGTPQWAALASITAQLNKGRLGDINPALYAIAHETPNAFHDVTRGQNGDAGITGFTAGRGWDAASGLGSPVGPNLAVALAAKR